MYLSLLETKGLTIVLLQGVISRMKGTHPLCNAHMAGTLLKPQKAIITITIQSHKVSTVTCMAWVKCILET